MSQPRSAASLLCALVVVAVLLAACTDNDPDAAATPTASPSASTVAAPPMATLTTPPRTTTTPTPGPPPYPDVPRPTGIFTEPRTTTPDETRTLGAAPASAFPAQQRGNTVLYDTRTTQAVDLGQGSVGFFSPDNRLFGWVGNFTSQDKPPELWVMNLETKEKWTVGSEFIGRFVDEHTIRARPEHTNDWVDIDVFTGERTPATANPFGLGVPQYRSGKHELVQDTYDRGTEDWWSVIDHETGQRILAFQSMRAAIVDEGTVALITPWTGTSANLFLVDVPKREATYVASVSLAGTYVTPLVANARYVVWIENFCRFPPDIRGKTRIYDRNTDRVAELDASLGAEGFTPDGRLRVGAGFGALALVDLPPLAYDVVLPEGAGVDIAWSPDFRYASSGTALGHGGVCP